MHFHGWVAAPLATQSRTVLNGIIIFKITVLYSLKCNNVFDILDVDWLEMSFLNINLDILFSILKLSRLVAISNRKTCLVTGTGLYLPSG